jgi:hypothetical protein
VAATVKAAEQTVAQAVVEQTAVAEKWACGSRNLCNQFQDGNTSV